MNQLDLIIKNATVILAKNSTNKKVKSYSGAEFFEEKIHVGIKDGKIHYLGNENIPSAQIIDAKGLHLLPGIIDSQVHFREPGFVHKEDIGTGSQAAAMGGVTSFFEMPNTQPATTTDELLKDKLARASKKSFVNYAFYVGASKENIASLKDLELAPGCAGIKIFVGSSYGSLLLDDVNLLDQVFRDGKRRIIVHSEEEARMQERKSIALESKDVRKHHIWRDDIGCFNSTKMLIELAEKHRRPLHILHVTTSQEMELIQSKQNTLGNLLTCEVLPQHLYFSAPECYEKLGSLTQQNPPIREKYHQEALWKALVNGTVTVMGSDHAPHTLEEKRKEYPTSPSGMPGVQTMLPVMLNFVNEGRLSLFRLVELLCENPRHVFGCKSKGRIEIGLDADITLVDLKKQKVIENKNMKSRVGWTPFDGVRITGWPKATIVKGQPVMQDDNLLGMPTGQPVLFS
jgi:dihydroorotase